MYLILLLGLWDYNQNILFVNLNLGDLRSCLCIFCSLLLLRWLTEKKATAPTPLMLKTSCRPTGATGHQAPLIRLRICPKPQSHPSAPAQPARGARKIKRTMSQSRLVTRGWIWRMWLCKFLLLSNVFKFQCRLCFHQSWQLIIFSTCPKKLWLLMMFVNWLWLSDPWAACGEHLPVLFILLLCRRPEQSVLTAARKNGSSCWFLAEWSLGPLSSPSAHVELISQRTAAGSTCVVCVVEPPEGKELIRLTLNSADS